MKKSVWIFLIVLISVLTVGIITASISNSNCNREKVTVIFNYESQSKEMQKYFDGITKSKENLLNTISQLEKNNYNTENLKTKFLILDNKVEKYKVDYNRFIQKLDELNSGSCNKENLELINLELKQISDQIQADSNDIRYYAPEVQLEVEKLAKEIDTTSK